jgi:hypothetical protein
MGLLIEICRNHVKSSVVATKEQQQKWRERKKQGEVARCPNCGGKNNNNLCVAFDLCLNKCWLKTPEGRAYNQERVARSLARKFDKVAKAKRRTILRLSKELDLPISTTAGTNKPPFIPYSSAARSPKRRLGATAVLPSAVQRDRKRVRPHCCQMSGKFTFQYFL